MSNKIYDLSSDEYSRIKHDQRIAASEFMKNRRVTEEVKKNMSDAQKLRFSKSYAHHLTGTKRRTESIDKMKLTLASKNIIYLPRSEDVKKRISATMKGVKKHKSTVEKFKQRRHTETDKNKISESLKKYHAKRKLDKIINNEIEK